jgi:anti-sigma factor RsiW
VTDGRWRISVTAPDWGQDHLSLDAIVAYVDDELAEGPYLRATRHLAQCAECAAQVFSQGQARSALRAAECPSLPSSLLSSLRAIPQEAELPGPPTDLAVTSDGQFVSVLRPERVAPLPEATRTAARADLRDQPPAGTGGVEGEIRDAGHHGRRPNRRLLVGTGVAMTGLAIGAIALAAPAVLSPQTPAPAAANGVLGGSLRGSSNAVDAQMHVSATPVDSWARRTSEAVEMPALAPLDAMPGSFYGIVP